MCLTCVDVKTERCNYGYKVFKKVRGGYFYPGFHLNAREIQEIELEIKNKKVELFVANKWMEDSADYDLASTIFMWDIPEGTDCNETYPTGMHVFFKEKDAKIYLKDTPDDFYGRLEVKKVRVQKVVASGYEEAWDKNGSMRLLKVMVCKKIKIEN